LFALDYLFFYKEKLIKIIKTSFIKKMFLMVLM